VWLICDFLQQTQSRTRSCIVSKKRSTRIHSMHRTWSIITWWQITAMESCQRCKILGTWMLVAAVIKTALATLSYTASFATIDTSARFQRRKLPRSVMFLKPFMAHPKKEMMKRCAWNRSLQRDARIRSCSEMQTPSWCFLSCSIDFQVRKFRKGWKWKNEKVPWLTTWSSLYSFVIIRSYMSRNGCLEKLPKCTTTSHERTCTYFLFRLSMQLSWGPVEHAVTRKTLLLATSSSVAATPARDHRE